MTYEEILEYYKNYKVNNKVVYDKAGNVITDEDVILKVKTSILLLNEARGTYKEDMTRGVRITYTQENYVKRTMEKFSVNNEENNFGTNKLTRAVLSSNGHLEIDMLGDELDGSKFSMLVEPKKDYGIAYLKLKFRERGLDIDGINITLDTSRFKKDGISTVILDFNIKKYEKKSESVKSVNSVPLFKHPRADDLNKLEEEKRRAIETNDDILYDYAQSSIEHIIRNNQVSIMPDEWDNLTDLEKVGYFNLKINEAKILKDKDAYDYWSANLGYLQSKINGSSFAADENSEKSR